MATQKIRVTVELERAEGKLADADELMKGLADALEGSTIEVDTDADDASLYDVTDVYGSA